jgi:hypothetical protein
MPTKEAADGAVDVFDPVVRGVGSAQDVVIGTFVGISDAGRPLVSHPLRTFSTPVEARSCVTLSADRIGQDVLMLFAFGDIDQPVIVGLLQGDRASCSSTRRSAAGASLLHIDVDADGERIVITARNEIVLRCGQARLTLTREGKVLLTGTYVSSRSSGVNRIKGGVVEIN